MSRIDYAEPDADEIRPLLDEISGGRPFVPNLYRMLLWSPGVTEGWVALANAVRFGSTVGARERELAILLTGHLTGSEYEWHHHSRLAEGVGITAQELEAIRSWPEADRWSADDRALLALVAAVVRREPLPEGDLASLVGRLGEQAVVELVATVGYYLAVAHFLIALDVETEPG